MSKSIEDADTAAYQAVPEMRKSRFNQLGPKLLFHLCILVCFRGLHHPRISALHLVDHYRDFRRWSDVILQKS